MAVPSNLFFDRTHRRSVYNIQPIVNIPSVILHGILSYNRAAALEHESNALTDVQSPREKVTILQGGKLHSYANAYFDPRNPMMYKRKGIAKLLCVLAISSVVLDFEGSIISDGNAASGYSRFY